MQSRPTQEPANDRTSLKHRKKLSPDARSWYLFCQFLWSEQDIPQDFTRDEFWVVHFDLPWISHKFFIPHKNSNAIYHALMLEIRKEVKWDFDRENLKSVAFYNLEDNWMAHVRFFYNDKIYSFPFPVWILEDDPFALTDEVPFDVDTILKRAKINKSNQIARERRLGFKVV